MADASEAILEQMKFHPGEAPHGMTFYDFSALPSRAQIQENALRYQVISENQMYLNAHPEIEVIVEMVIKAFLIDQPRHNIHEFAATIFSRPKYQIEEEIVLGLRRKDSHNVTVCHRPSTHFNIESETAVTSKDLSEMGGECKTAHCECYVHDKSEDTVLPLLKRIMQE